MVDWYNLLVLLLPCFSLFTFIVLAKILIKWARAQHVGAFELAAVIPMLLLAPYAERTITVIQKAKKEIKQKENKKESQL